MKSRCRTYRFSLTVLFVMGMLFQQSLLAQDNPTPADSNTTLEVDVDTNATIDNDTNSEVVEESTTSAPVAELDTFGTTTLPISASSPLSMQVEFRDVEVGKTEMAANRIVVQNNSNEAVTFGVDMALPEGWRAFGLTRAFQVEPGSRIIIPLRLLPKGLMGSTRFFIGINLLDEKGEPIVGDYFNVSSYKNVDWAVNFAQGSRIYFRNGERRAKFDVSVFNKGNYRQDMIMTMQGQREDLQLYDSIGRPVETPKYNLSIASLEDTSFSFEIETMREKRNFQSISLQDYRPRYEIQEKTYTMFVNTAEAKASSENVKKRGNKIEFVRLGNEKKANAFSGPVLPLIVEANVQNIMSNNPFVNLMLRGYNRFDNGSNLIYFAQFNYSQAFYSDEFWRNSAYYIGYFHRNFSTEFGNIGGNIIGIPSIGRGGKVSGRIIGNHWVGAFYQRSPTLFGPTNRESYGAFYKYIGRGPVRGTLGYGRSTDVVKRRTADVINGRGSVRVAKGHTISFVGAFSNRLTESDTSADVRQGYLVGLGYSGRWFRNNRLTLNQSTRYQNPRFGLSDNERITNNTRFTVNINPTTRIFINSSFNENRYPLNSFNGVDTVTNMYMYNYIAYSKNTSFGTVQPYVYAQANDVVNKRINSWGIGARYSNFVFKKNVLWSTNVSGGYDKAYWIPDLAPYFTFRMNGLLRVRTLTTMLGYFYGPTSPQALESALATEIIPQYIRASMSHQYLFKNRSFAMQNSVNFTYQNQTRNARISYFPEVFYFTKTGWRFSVNFNFSFSYRKTRGGLVPNSGGVVREEQTFNNSDFRMGASVRKEFAIPVPFTKKKNFTKQFIAFYDLNGNSTKDSDEPALENVVIRLGSHEVLTARGGMARIVHLEGGEYGFGAFSLDKLEGWFANIPDSMSVTDDGIVNIPFTKGVKLYGKIIIDREKLAVDADKKMDLGNIRIFAIGAEEEYYSLTNVDGEFEFYLPNGSYTVSLNESILGNKFRILNNNVNVELTEGLEGMFITFYIVEKKRKVKKKVFGKPRTAPENGK